MMGPPLVKARPAMTELPCGDGSAESSFDLLLRAKEGDVSALDQLCARYLPRVKRWAHGRLPVSSRALLDSEDLAQDVLRRAVEHLDGFDPRHEGAFPGYLRRMLKNQLIDEGRKHRRRPMPAQLDDEHPVDGPSPLERAIGQEALDRYEAALVKLRPKERALIVAKLELGLSASELAVEFQMPTAAAAHMAVSRALVRLAREMAHA
jgi:RNA polymerase sigma factor (sigma-70 family)